MVMPSIRDAAPFVTRREDRRRSSPVCTRRAQCDRFVCILSGRRAVKPFGRIFRSGRKQTRVISSLMMFSRLIDDLPCARARARARRECNCSMRWHSSADTTILRLTAGRSTRLRVRGRDCDIRHTSQKAKHPRRRKRTSQINESQSSVMAQMRSKALPWRTFSLPVWTRWRRLLCLKCFASNIFTASRLSSGNASSIMPS